MSSNELIRFLTEEFVGYLDTPRDERIKRRQEKRQRETWQHRWFGDLGLSVIMYWHKVKARQREK